MDAPTLADVYRARQAIAPYLRPTPLVRSDALSELLGCSAYLKCENVQPIGVFKVRGGINLVSFLSEEERRRGVITASTGNHGQSIAYAARLFGVPATIAAPDNCNPYKRQAMERLGARVKLVGRDFDESRVWVGEEAARRGYRYVHAANEPLIIAGVGTMSLEIMEELPEVDVIINPIGGGSGCASHCIVAKEIKPDVQVIGVQAERAPAVYLSWKAGELRETESSDTFAEGLATRVAFELPFSIIKDRIDDIVLVSDEEMAEAVVTLLDRAHMLAEPAGAAPLAAAVKMRERLRGKRVVLVLTGANITVEQLRAVLDKSSRSSLTT
jgi:threonine dehydratase